LHSLIPSSTVRLVEEAADELGRLDSLSQIAPPAYAQAARAAVIAQLEGSPSGLVALVAAGVDPVHAAVLSASLDAWARVVDDSVRRVRGGTQLHASHFASVVAGQAELRDPAALETALRSGGELRSVLVRGVSSAAAVGEGPMSELAPALLLCATGHLDRPWLLPFVDADPAARREALAEWADGDPIPLLEVLLSACSTSARARRLGLRRLLQSVASEEQSLTTLGRAAISARRALSVLRDSLAITMPGLAERLDCSRPAAGDALARLDELGLAREITGRERDRVFVHAAAWMAVA
jgi:hypothetical protein